MIPDLHNDYYYHENVKQPSLRFSSLPTQKKSNITTNNNESDPISQKGDVSDANSIKSSFESIYSAPIKNSVFKLPNNPHQISQPPPKEFSPQSNSKGIKNIVNNKKVFDTLNSKTRSVNSYDKEDDVIPEMPAKNNVDSKYKSNNDNNEQFSFNTNSSPSPSFDSAIKPQNMKSFNENSSISDDDSIGPIRSESSTTTSTFPKKTINNPNSEPGLLPISAKHLSSSNSAIRTNYQRTLPESTTVTINIGRIDVRAIVSSQKQSPTNFSQQNSSSSSSSLSKNNQTPLMTLHDYLRKRSERLF